MKTIEVFAVGHIHGNKAKCGILLRLGDKIFEVVKDIEDATKNQADIVAAILALRCIKPEYKSYQIILGIAGYAYSVLECGGDGEWVINARANLEIVQEARSLVQEFPNIQINKVSSSNHMFRKCIEMAQNAH